MKCKDIISSGIQDLKAQRKKNRVSFLLIFLSLIVYIGVNSTMDSIKNGIYDGTKGNKDRFLYVSTSDTWETAYEYTQKKYGDDERVEEIVVGILGMPFFYLQDAEELFGVEEQELSISTFYEPIFDYGYKGEKREPEYDEIILPRYIYDMGIYTDKQYLNCDKLIGETLTFKYKIWDCGEDVEYKLKVIGTYDNISVAYSDLGIIGNRQFTRDIFDLQYTYADEYFIKEYGEIDDSFYREYAVLMFIKQGYDIDEVCREMNAAAVDDTDDSIHITTHVWHSEDITSYYDYIAMMGTIISFMILIIAVINIIISSISEVKHRKWEFALKMSMGYRRKDIISIFAVEKIVNVLKALGVALVTLLLYSVVLTYYYKNLMEFWKRSYIIKIAAGDVIIGMVLVVMAAMMGVITARFLIGNIKIAETLKSGD